MTEHEELLMLRALAAKQAQELEASKKIIQERDEKIRRQNIQIDNMIQALLHAWKKLFGPSTEVTQMDGQLSLFESVQELAEQLESFKRKDYRQALHQDTTPAGSAQGNAGRTSAGS